MNHERHRVQRIVLALITDLETARGIDREEAIVRSTRLFTDLGYTEVHCSALAMRINATFGRMHGRLEHLFYRDGRLRYDIRAADVVDFAWEQLAPARHRATAPARRAPDNVIPFPRANRRAGYQMAHI